MKLVKLEMVWTGQRRGANMGGMVVVRVLGPGKWEVLWDVRLAALRDAVFTEEQWRGPRGRREREFRWDRWHGAHGGRRIGLGAAARARARRWGGTGRRPL